jgi:beta-lactamase superfamily II metal-dependent hydrolase
MLLLAWLACQSSPAPSCARVSALAEPGLTITQLHLTQGSMGEATLVRGPDGTTVLIDVGNDAHHSQIVEAVGGTHVDHIVVTHEHADHADGLAELTSDTLTTWETRALPVTLPLGEGAELVVFLADGRLATATGTVDLWDSLGDPGSEGNPRSVAGVIRWGAFSYLFAGDLTGGGKGTLDVESAVAARRTELPWVPEAGVTALHVNHHGISSSTNPTWASWLRPRLAVVGANGRYLDAPSPEALEALAPWVDAVYVTEPGRLGNTDARTCVAHGPVQLQAGAGGAAVGVSLVR